MRYTQLRAFHHVANAGGFSHAAARLNQTQPSISDQVRRLEQAHDVLLFHREPRGVRLTRAGEDLLRLTRTFFEAEEAIAGYLEGHRATVSGRLRLVADSAVHVTTAIGRFRVAHPGVAVTLGAGNTAEVLARVRDYDAELGVVGNLGPAPDMMRIELGRSPVVGIAAHGLLPGNKDTLDVSELARWPLVFREEGSRTRSLLEQALAALDLSLAPTIEVEGREAMREVVAAGAGLGFISDAEFGVDPRLRKVAITGIDLTMTETLVALRQRIEVPAIRAFLRSLT